MHVCVWVECWFIYDLLHSTLFYSESIRYAHVLFLLTPSICPTRFWTYRFFPSSVRAACCLCIQIHILQNSIFSIPFMQFHFPSEWHICIFTQFGCFCLPVCVCAMCMWITHLIWCSSTVYYYSNSGESFVHFILYLNLMFSVSVSHRFFFHLLFGHRRHSERKSNNKMYGMCIFLKLPDAFIMTPADSNCSMEMKRIFNQDMTYTQEE